VVAVARSVILAATCAVAGMACVGSSVAVTTALVGAPVFTAQAVRYALACLLLILIARAVGRSIRRPRRTEWLWLLAVATTGLVLFNLAIVRGLEHAEPAVIGVAVACVPTVLALVGPLHGRGRPSARVVAAALVVTVGAIVVEGGGRADATGVAWASMVLACEAAFTLCAVPVLGRLGPWGVSVHTTWIAALMLVLLGIAAEGPDAAGRLEADDLLAAGYLAVMVTAVAFVLWYSAVDVLGSARAGLVTGVAPAAAGVCGVLVGAGVPSGEVWLGMAVIGVGLAVGLGATSGEGDPQPARGLVESLPQSALESTSRNGTHNRPDHMLRYGATGRPCERELAANAES